MRFLFIKFILILFSVSGLFAQNDFYGSFSDPQLLFVNPAFTGNNKAIQFQSAIQYYYTGFGSIQKRSAAVDMPLNYVNAGLTFSSFSAGVMDRQTAQLELSRAIFSPKIIVGLQAGFFSLSFNKSEFTDIDDNDPILSGNLSKTVPTLGAGFLINVYKNAHLGYSLNNLNQPNIAFGDAKERLPLEQNYHLFYDWRWLHPFIHVNRDLDWSYAFGSDFSAFKNMLAFRAVVASSFFELGFGLNVKNVQMNYYWQNPINELNGFGGSSHRVQLVYALKPDWRDFSLKVKLLKPVVPEIDPGENLTFDVSVNSKFNFKELVKLSAPKISGLDIKFLHDEIYPSQKTIVSIQTNLNSRSGSYKIPVTGEWNGKKRIALLKFDIKSTLLLEPEISCTVDTLQVYHLDILREKTPLLNYVFFRDGQHKLLKERYNILNPQQAPLDQAVFFEENITNINDQYRQMLNILAQRLQRFPQAQITINGFNSGFGAERNNLKLSQNRAQAVADYFTTVWKIDPKRITISANNLPQNFADSRDPLGRAENQRVEITTDVPEVMEPVFSVSQKMALSDSICYFLTHKTKADAGLKRWQIIIKGDSDNIFHIISGKGALPARVKWDWKNHKQKMIEAPGHYSYRLVVEDKRGKQAATDWLQIPVLKKTFRRKFYKKETEKIRLMLFQFDRDDIDLSSPDLRKSIAEIADTVLQNKNVNVIVNGFTDIIGTELYNFELSNRRALAIVNLLQRLGVPAEQIKMNGYGPNNPLMNNDLPEGRMMNRRVEVILEYPETEN